MPTDITGLTEHQPTSPPDVLKPAPAESGSNPANKTAQVPIPKSFETRKFKNEVGTGKSVGHRDKETGKAGEIITISKETEAQYVYFLKDYLTTFSDALKLNPSLRDNMAAETGKKLLEMMTDAEGRVDSAKINEFLSSPQGWIVTTEVMNEYALQLNSVLGFVAHTLPPSERGAELKEEKIKIEGKEEKPGRLQRLREWMNNRAKKPSGDKFLQFEAKAGLFEELKNNPEEKAYIKAVMGIDLDDYQLAHPIFGDKVEKVPGRLNPNNQSPDLLRRNILQLMQARRSFLNDLGVPPKNMDSLPEEALFSGGAQTDEGFEPTGLKWEKEINDKFKVVFNFDPYVGESKNVINFNRIRREVVLRYVSEIMIKDALENPNKIASAVAERLKAINDSGETGEKARHTKEAKAKKTVLEAEKGKVEAKKSPSDDLEAKQEKVKEIEMKARDKFKLDMTGGLNVGADAEISKLTTELEGGIGGTPGLLDQLDTADSEWQAEYDKKYNEISTSRTAALTTKKGELSGTVNSGEVAEIATQAANALRKRKIEALKIKIGERETKINDIKQLRTDYVNAQKESAEGENKFILNKDVPKNLVEIRNNYEMFVNATGATITPTQLESQTVDQLIAFATAPPYSLLNATPEQQKTLREMLLRAKTENKAMQAEANDLSPQAQRDALSKITTVPGATVSLNSLLTTPEQRLTLMLSQSPHNLSQLEIQRILPLARAEARKKLIFRHKIGHEEQITDLNNQIKTQDKMIENAENLDKLKETVTMTNILIQKQGEILNRVIGIPLEVNRYTNPDIVIDTHTEYSKAERDLVLPKAYYEMLNVLFNYQLGGKIGDQTLNREEYFKRIHDFLPPNKLLSLMRESMGIASPNFSILNPNIFTSNTELLVGFEKIINNLGKEAIAL